MTSGKRPHEKEESYVEYRKENFHEAVLSWNHLEERPKHSGCAEGILVALRLSYVIEEIC